MNRIDIKKFGLSWGLTGALIYMGCVLLMMAAGREGVIFLFNSLFHGMDIAPILRTDMPAWEMLIGIVETFVFSWIVGATIAAIYNFGMKPNPLETRRLKMKLSSITVLVALALTLSSVPGWAQQSSGKTGKSMMGGQQGSMMQNKAPMGQGQMMPDMMDMMNQMSGMMNRMSDMMKGMPAGDIQNMSALMGNMSRQMNEMAQAMARGQISDDHMQTMQENMAHMQNRLTEIEKK